MLSQKIDTGLLICSKEVKALQTHTRGDEILCAFVSVRARECDAHAE